MSPPSNHAWRLWRGSRSVMWLLLDEHLLRTVVCLAAALFFVGLGLYARSDELSELEAAGAVVFGLCLALVCALDVRLAWIGRHPDGLRVISFGLRSSARFDLCYQDMIGALARVGGAIRWSYETRNSFEHDLNVLVSSAPLSTGKDRVSHGPG